VFGRMIFLNFTHKMTLLKKSFSQQHMLVDFEYLSLNESFGLEIWHTYYQHRYGLITKISCQKKNFNPWKIVKVGSKEIFLTGTYVGRFKYLFFFVNVLALKFCARVICIKMML